MNRLENWRPTFLSVITAHRPHPFEWGLHDCAILSADAVFAVTGLDLAATYRGHYSTKQGAREILLAHGHQTAVDPVAMRFQEIHPSQCVVGDLAVVETRYGPATAPVVGAELAAYSRAGVLGSVPLSAAKRAFRIEI